MAFIGFEFKKILILLRVNNLELARIKSIMKRKLLMNSYFTLSAKEIALSNKKGYNTNGITGNSKQRNSLCFDLKIICT